MISLRTTVDPDYAFMRALYGSYRAEEMKHFPLDEEGKERFLDQQFHAQTVYYAEHYPGAELNIIEDDGNPIGRFFVDRREREIRIMDIALVESSRNHGIASSLIKAVLDEGAARGLKVTIHVEMYNPALRLYERLGFRNVASNGVYYLMEWAPLT